MHTDLMANISMNQYRFPSKEDFSGAIAAIRRLQDTYQLQPTVIASGKLGSSSALPMSGESAHTTTSKLAGTWRGIPLPHSCLGPLQAK